MGVGPIFEKAMYLPLGEIAIAQIHPSPSKSTLWSVPDTASQSRMLPSNEPEMMLLESRVNMAGRTALVCLRKMEVNEPCVVSYVTMECYSGMTASVLVVEVAVYYENYVPAVG